MDVIDEDWEEWAPEKGKFWHHMVAGSCAGVMEHTAMFPFDTYKVRCARARLAVSPFSPQSRFRCSPVPVIFSRKHA
jgi:hypothetical protein